MSTLRRYSPGLICALLTLLYIYLFPIEADLDTLLISQTFNRGGGTPHLVHMGYLVSYPLAWMNAFFGQWEPVSVLLLALQSLAFVFIGHVWLGAGKEKAPLAILIGTGCLLLTTSLVCKSIHYTHISFLGMGAALLMLQKKHEGMLKSLLFQAGIGFYFIICASLRYDSCMGILPVLLLIFAYRFCRSLKAEGLPRAFLKQSIYPIMAAAVLFIPHLQMQLGQVPMAEGRPAVNIVQANETRISFFDYPDDSGLNKTQAYREIDFTPNDQRLYELGIIIDLRADRDARNRRLHAIRKEGNGTFTLSPTANLNRLTRFGHDHGAIKRFIFFNGILGMLWLITAGEKRRLSLAAGGGHLLCCAAVIALGRYSSSAPLSIFLPFFFISSYCATQTPYMGKALSPACGRWLTALLLLGAAVYCGGQYMQQKGETVSPHHECFRHVPGLCFVYGHFYPIPPFSLYRADCDPFPNVVLYNSWPLLSPAYDSYLKKRGMEFGLHSIGHGDCYFIAPTPGEKTWTKTAQAMGALAVYFRERQTEELKFHQINPDTDDYILWHPESRYAAPPPSLFRNLYP